MDAKRKPADDGEVRVVNKRRALTLLQKIAILDKLAEGKGSTFVARTFGLNEGTVRSIKKREDKIRSSVAAGTPHNAKMTCYARDVVLRKMEKVLMDWIVEQNLKEIPIDGTIIRKEAKRLYDQFKANDEANDEIKPGSKPTTFLASKGWYEKFRKRFSVYNSTLGLSDIEYMDPFNDGLMENDVLFPEYQIENLRNDTDITDFVLDHDEAKNITSQLLKIISLKKYTPQQVFNASETGLYWKKMPKKTFLSEEENNTPGSKFSRDKLHLLLCINASGDCVVKPMAVYRSLNPRSLRGKNKHQLPVFWKANSRICITAAEFTDWFHNCFIQEVKLYCVAKNIPFQILLILDTLPCHPFNLQDADPNIKIVFLPVNTAQLVQPLDQGFTKIFLTNYTCRIFRHIVDAKAINPFISVSELWWDYTIADCLKFIKETLEDIRPSSTNACWYKLWSDVVIDMGDLPAAHHVIDKIVELGHAIGGDGFKDLEATEVEDLIDSHEAELKDEDLNALTSLSDDYDSDDNTEAVILRNQLTIESLEKGFKLAKELKDVIFTVDPFMERGFQSMRGIEDALEPYREMYDELLHHKNLLINNAFQKLKTKSSIVKKSPK